MAKRRFWWPGTIAEQYMTVKTIMAMIGSYAVQLALSPAEVAAIQTTCSLIMQSIEFTNQAKSYSQACVDWRIRVMYGKTVGKASSAQPIAPLTVVDETTEGLVAQLTKWRDQIIAKDGYTKAIGEAIGILAAEITPQHRSTVAPVFKAAVGEGYSVTLRGSMQGFGVMRVDYAVKGGEFKNVAIVTDTPATIRIEPVEPGTPETGVLRSVFMKKNENYGNYSDMVPVTLS